MKIHLSVQQLQGFIHVSEGGLELCAQTQGSDGGMMMRDLAFFSLEILQTVISFCLVTCCGSQAQS